MLSSLDDILGRSFKVLSFLLGLAEALLESWLAIEKFP